MINENINKIKYLSSAQVENLLNSYDKNDEYLYIPLGLFISKGEDGLFLAFDNRTGDCFTEEFDIEARAIGWLLSNQSKEDYLNDN